MDDRFGDYGFYAVYNADEVPVGTSSEQLLEMTKEKMKIDTEMRKKYGYQINGQPNSGNNLKLLSLIIISACIVLLIILIKHIYHFKNEKGNETE